MAEYSFRTEPEVLIEQIENFPPGSEYRFDLLKRISESGNQSLAKHLVGFLGNNAEYSLLLNFYECAADKDAVFQLMQEQSLEVRLGIAKMFYGQLENSLAHSLVARDIKTDPHCAELVGEIETRLFSENSMDGFRFTLKNGDESQIENYFLNLMKQKDLDTSLLIDVVCVAQREIKELVLIAIELERSSACKNAAKIALELNDVELLQASLLHLFNSEIGLDVCENLIDNFSTYEGVAHSLEMYAQNLFSLNPRLYRDQPNYRQQVVKLLRFTSSTEALDGPFGHHLFHDNKWFKSMVEQDFPDYTPDAQVLEKVMKELCEEGIASIENIAKISHGYCVAPNAELLRKSLSRAYSLVTIPDSKKCGSDSQNDELIDKMLAAYELLDFHNATTVLDEECRAVIYSLKF